MLIQRPRRYGRALRRLLQGKTEAVVRHIAYQLEQDGLVLIKAENRTASALPCTLTPAGVEAAKQALAGNNPYRREND